MISVTLRSKCSQIALLNLKQTTAQTSRRLVSTTKSLLSAAAEDGSTNDENEKFYDVVVCGSGMVGTAMAAALSKNSLFKNKKIGLIESMPKPKPYSLPDVHSNRVVALNGQTVRFLKELDALELIEPSGGGRYGPVRHMHVWDAKSDASITFDGSEENEDNNENLAIIVENDLVQASLARSAAACPNLDVIYGSRISDFSHADNFVEIKLAKEGGVLRTKLLIGSDGINSFVRQKAELPTMRWNYDQVALVATLRLADKQVNDTAWQRFLPTGPIALLPLDSEYSSLVWSVKSQFAKELLNCDDDQFVHRVNQAFVDTEEYRVDEASTLFDMVEKGMDLARDAVPGLRDHIVDRDLVASLLPPKIEASLKGSRGSFPLTFLHSNKYVSERIALIGDAVHKVHPLAGQGVNLGFGDVICLMENLTKSLENGGDLGSAYSLSKYESRRQRDAYPKTLGIDLLSKLYTDHSYSITRPLVALRTAGLAMSNRIVPLKKFFVEQAINK